MRNGFCGCCYSWCENQYRLPLSYPGKGGEGGLGNESFQRGFRDLIKVNGFPKPLFLKRMLSTSSCVSRLWSCVKLFFRLWQQSSFAPSLLCWVKVWNGAKKWEVGWKGRALLFLPLEMCSFTSVKEESQSALSSHPHVRGSVSRGTCPEWRWLHGAHGLWGPHCQGDTSCWFYCAECHSDVPLHLSNTSSYLLQLQWCHSVTLGVLDLDLVVFFLRLFQMNNCDSKMLW